MEEEGGGSLSLSLALFFMGLRAAKARDFGIHLPSGKGAKMKKGGRWTNLHTHEIRKGGEGGKKSNSFPTFTSLENVGKCCTHLSFLFSPLPAANTNSAQQNFYLKHCYIGTLYYIGVLDCT